jgi:hypothetical protein
MIVREVQAYFAQLPFLGLSNLLRRSGRKLNREHLFCADVSLWDGECKRRRCGQCDGKGGLELHDAVMVPVSDNISSSGHPKLLSMCSLSGLYMGPVPSS